MTTRDQEKWLESAMNLRPAASTDLSEITRLLAETRLPTSGVEKHLEDFVVVETSAEEVASASGGLAGVGGLEIHGRIALLRSLAVKAERRRQGIASMICARLEEDAARRGISHIYLLTETAESFFAERGYSEIARDAAPAEITATEEFMTLCPDSAVLMVRAC